MDKPTFLSVSTDYRPALLWIMAQLEQAKVADVLNEFERQLGHLIPSEHMDLHEGRIKRWENFVHWSRQALVNVGLMGSAGRGVWTITKEGLQWLETHPDGGKSELITWINATYKTRRGHLNGQSRHVQQPGASRLQGKKDAAIHAYRMLDQRILDIRRLLQGRATIRPTDEVLCDWVLFCYDFELYAEGAQLFALINSSQVNDWLYKRARKLAQACKTKQMHVQDE